MRDVPLSISSSNVRNFHRGGDPDERRASGRGIENGEKRFECFGLYVPVREIGRQLPQIVLTVTSKQGINLIFEVADRKPVQRNFVALNERSFESSRFPLSARE